MEGISFIKNQESRAFATYSKKNPKFFGKIKQYTYTSNDNEPLGADAPPLVGGGGPRSGGR
jgi:hypothetical protein